MEMVLAKIIRKWKNRKRYKALKDMPTWLLASIGIPSAMAAGCWGFELKDIIQVYFKETNRVGMDIIGLSLGLIILILSLYTWFIGLMAKRCCDVFRDRYLT